jgi:hypothetical protein
VGLSYIEQGLSITKTNIKEWWTQIIKTQGQGNDVQRASLITYAAWNLWKERCRRVFSNKVRTTEEVFHEITNDVQKLGLAHEEFH